MDKNGNNFRSTEQEDGHISEDELLLYADGELSRENAAHAEAHLEACWSCRARAEKYEETIRSYVDYRENVLKPMDDEPPGGWRKFDRMLNEVIVEKGHPSMVSRLRGWFGSLRPPLPVLSLNPQLAGRLVAVIVIIALSIAILLFKSNQVTTVSANELVQRAVDAQAASLRSTSQPVLHQRLQVRRKAQLNEETVMWETWNDVINVRFAQRCDGCRIRQSTESGAAALATRHATPANLVSDLNAVLITNHMDPQRPLSATSYKSWRDSIGQKQEDIVRTKLTGGQDAWTLRTFSIGSAAEGQITEASFTIRASDWHPVQQQLTVKAADGAVLFELLETHSEVMSLSQIDPTIFATTREAAGLSPDKHKTGSTPTAFSPVAPNTLSIAASADLEVETMRLLHQVGADLGEQIHVKRSAGGSVSVVGIVETNERKIEILAALNSISRNRAVQIDIQTVAEAIEKQKSSISSPKTSREPVEIEASGIATEPELRAYFERHTTSPDTAVRQFASDMVSKSASAMQHLGAMQRLVKQFSTEQLRHLTPEAHAKWLGLVRSHARAFQQKSAAMRQELKPVFFSGASEDLPEVAAVDGDEELKLAVQELLTAGVANDQVIRSAFTVTNQGPRVTAIGTSQFWQAMKRAEAEAAAIARQ